MTRIADRPTTETTKAQDAGDSARATLDVLTAQLAALGRMFTVLSARLDAEAETAEQKEEEHALRLGEAQRELAEARCALETEKKARGAAERRVDSMKAAISAAQASLNAIAIAPRDVADDETDVDPTARAEPSAGDEAMPLDDAETNVPAFDEMIGMMTEEELAALDQLVVIDGHRDRASLVRALCIRALTGAGLLGGAPLFDRKEAGDRGDCDAGPA